MVPLPAIVFNALSGPLQLFASNVATALAQGLGVAVYRDGNIINLANISLGVDEACSGLNSLSSMMVKPSYYMLGLRSMWEHLGSLASVLAVNPALHCDQRT